MIELTKGQKKTARLLIDRALQRECETFLNKTREFSQQTMQNGQSPHENYLALYKIVYDFDKHVAQCYDNMSGSHYLPTIIDLYVASVLTDEDISLFDEELKEYIKRIKRNYDLS